MASENHDSFLRGFLFGGVIGAVLALLYAPKSGKETREDIKRRSRELLEEMDEQLADVRTQAAKILDEGKKEAEKLRAEAEKRLEEARKRAEKIIDEGKASVASLRTEASGKIEEAKGKARETVGKGKSQIKKKASKIKEAVDEGVKAYHREVDDSDKA